jgi:hypothetical protein
MRGRPPHSLADHWAKGTATKASSKRQPPRTGAFRKIGPPRNSLPPEQLSAWRQFVKEMPWLCESDRSILEVACVLRAELESGKGFGSGRLSLLRQVLAQMGGTPADRHRVTIWPDDGDEDAAQPPRKGYFAS